MRVFGFIVVDTSHGDFNGAIGDMIDKGAVVRDDDYGFSGVDQEIPRAIEWIRYRGDW